MSGILRSVKSRKSRWGIGRASSYLKAFAGCWSNGFCPANLIGHSGEEWESALKSSEKQLVYSDEALKTKEFSDSDVPDGAVLVFKGIITSTRKDRDRDILESKGATVDPNHALLSQHNPLQPVGKFIELVEKTNKRVVGNFAIADMPLGRDHAVLVKFGALRISHGFDPTKFEPLDDSDEMSGWLIKEFEILETSLVSVPSNVDAVILESFGKSFEKQYEQELDGIRTVFDRGMLETDVMLQWAKSHFDSRPVQGKGLAIKGQPEVCDCNDQPVKSTKMQCSECGHKGPSIAFEQGQDKHTVSSEKGDSLASVLNSRIDDMVTDDMSRADIVSAMGDAAGIASGTVNQILVGFDDSGEHPVGINCPPRVRLEGFSETLNISVSSLISAAERDGCNYDVADNRAFCDPSLSDMTLEQFLA